MHVGGYELVGGGRAGSDELGFLANIIGAGANLIGSFIKSRQTGTAWTPATGIQAATTGLVTGVPTEIIESGMIAAGGGVKKGKRAQLPPAPVPRKMTHAEAQQALQALKSQPKRGGILGTFQKAAQRQAQAALREPDVATAAPPPPPPRPGPPPVRAVPAPSAPPPGVQYSAPIGPAPPPVRPAPPAFAAGIPPAALYAGLGLLALMALRR